MFHISLAAAVHLSVTTVFCAAALRCCVHICKTTLRKYRVAWLPQRQKPNFGHIHFLCNFCAISGGSKAAARQARLLQDCCKAHKVFVRVRQPRICPMKVTRLSRYHHAMTLRFIARLPQECFKTYDPLIIVQWPHGCTAGIVDISLYLAAVLQICMTILWQPCI